MKKRIKCLCFLLLCCLGCKLQAQEDRTGLYFSGTGTPPAVLPGWSAARDVLPSPVFDEDPLLVETYWKAWELAYRHFNMPAPGSGFISPFIDAAFNDNIFLWDTGFMTMFCNYGYPLVPGIGSLDNFYVKQHADGEICREIVRKTGKDYQPWVNSEGKSLFSRGGYGVSKDQPQGKEIIYVQRAQPSPAPLLTLDGLNHPILAWAEWESYLITGNKERLFQIWKPLVKYQEALEKYIRQGNGLYMTDWASMDNSTRNPMLKSGGTGIDISCEMVLFDLNLADIAEATGKPEEAARFRKKAAALSLLINRKMWNEKQHFYTDLTVNGEQSGIKTVAGFWTLLAKVASRTRAAELLDQLKDPATFGTVNPVPTLAADEKGFSPTGNYWCGSVWAPTNTMVIRGLENYGYYEQAYQIAMKHLHLVAGVYKKTGTIWENYSPESATYGLHADGSAVEKDFVGWSGIGPIMYFIEYAIGLKANAPKNEIVWMIRSTHPSGCRNFRFNNRVASLLAIPDSSRQSLKIQVEASAPFTLKIQWNGHARTLAIPKGSNTFAW
ncbi:MAG TPA: trehalase family glycosidase [Puia sp.]|nr:trehalase family glycosidase [Puia sp.]